MKKVAQMFIVVFVAALALMYLTSYLNARHGYSGADTLTIYNWGDYIDPDLIVEFERETGLKIIYQTFDSNEAMLTKISHGGTTFDVVIPSDYAISKMKEQGTAHSPRPFEASKRKVHRPPFPGHALR